MINVVYVRFFALALVLCAAMLAGCADEDSATPQQADASADVAESSDAGGEQPDVVADTEGSTDTATPDTRDDRDVDEPEWPLPNLVLVVLDDVGIEMMEPWRSAIGARSEPAITPTLDAIAAEGVVFHTAWATPTCSPTRLGLHTGLYPSHGGILGPIGRATPLTADTVTLPRFVGGSYRAGLFGKWHLGGEEDAPVTLGGWHYYSGQPTGGLMSYFAWNRTVVDAQGNVNTEPETTYATTAVMDDALAWLGEQPPASPWLVMLALNAPHTPFHLPPPNLRPDYSEERLDPNGDGVCDDDLLCYLAAIQAADTELGRFLGAAQAFEGDRGTVVVVIGDNGTPSAVLQQPYSRRHGKGTLYEGGIRVPVWMNGPPELLPTQGRIDGLAHAGVDVFATLVELAGQEVPAGVDGVSLMPMLKDSSVTVRDTLYTDGDSGSMDMTAEGAVLRDATFKVHWFDVTVPDSYGCYDLSVDPDEQDDLMLGEPPAVCAELFEQLKIIR